MIVNGVNWWLVSIGSCNGLVPSGNKPLPEPMLTQISVVIWRQYASTAYIRNAYRTINMWLSDFQMWGLPSRSKWYLSLNEFWTHRRHTKTYFPSAINHISTHCVLDTMQTMHRILSWNGYHHAYIDTSLKFIPMSKELQHATISSYNGSEPIRWRDNAWATDDLVEKLIKCTIMQRLFGMHFRQ